MPRCAKIMHKFVWVMPLRCSPSSTIPSLGCLLDRGPPMLLRPDAHSPIISTEHSLLSWLKVEIRLCNSPDLCSRLLDRRAETWYIYVVGYIVLEDEMGDTKIDKQGTEEFPFPNGGNH